MGRGLFYEKIKKENLLSLNKMKFPHRKEAQIKFILKREPKKPLFSLYEKSMSQSSTSAHMM